VEAQVANLSCSCAGDQGGGGTPTNFLKKSSGRRTRAAGRAAHLNGEWERRFPDTASRPRVTAGPCRQNSPAAESNARSRRVIG